MPRPSRRWVERRFTTIVHWSEPERGGHFAAWEQPDLFVADLRATARANIALGADSVASERASTRYLGERGGDRFKEYSLGMKQRLGIAGALLGHPDLLILDEPTNGLDPIGMREIRELITRIAGQDRTVLVSSHLLGEIEQVCDWLVVIERGAGVYAGPAREFFGGTDPTLVVAPERPEDVPSLARLLAAHGHEVDVTHDRVLVTIGDGDEPRCLAARLNRIAHEDGIVLAELSQRHRNLDDRYLNLVQGGVR